MPSGKTARQKRRSAGPPPVRTRGTRAARQASPRVLIAAAAVVIAIVAGVVAIVLSRGSSNPAQNVPAVGSLAGGLPGAASVNALFKGVPQHGTTLGSRSAPVTMTEFIDLQCPYCQAFETTSFPTIVKTLIRRGKLKVVMEPWAFIGPDSLRGQAAVLAAARQNRAFNYAELLYDNQATENTGWLNDAMVAAAAESIPGLRVPRLLSSRNSAAVKAAARRVDKLAQAEGVRGTPTIFVGKTGTRGFEVVLRSPTDVATLSRAITKALR